MTKDKVRPNSRAGLVVKAMLDAGEVTEVRYFRHQDLLTPGGVPCLVEDVAAWARGRGMELRPHDIVELGRNLAIIGCRNTYSGEAIRLQALHVARGRWALATDWAHDFEDDGRGWTVLPARGLPLISPEA